MAGRQSGNEFNAATSFATVIVLTLGYVFSLGVIFAFADKAEWNAFIVSSIYAMLAYWLLVPSRRTVAGSDEMSAISSAHRKIVTKKHHYKLKRIRKSSGRLGSNKPPTAEEIRELKESSVVFVAPPNKPRP